MIRNKIKFSEKNSELEADISKSLRKSQRTAEDIKSLKDFILKKTQLEDQLTKSVKMHEQLEYNLATELVQCKSELLDAQTFYQQFDIKVIQLMLKSTGKMILKRNNDGDYMAELQYKGKKESFLIRELDNVCEHPTKQNRLILKYKTKNKEIFSEQSERIVNRLRELMQKYNL